MGTPEEDESLQNETIHRKREQLERFARERDHHWTELTHMLMSSGSAIHPRMVDVVGILPNGGGVLPKLCSKLREDLIRIRHQICHNINENTSLMAILQERGLPHYAITAFDV